MFERTQQPDRFNSSNYLHQRTAALGASSPARRSCASGELTKSKPDQRKDGVADRDIYKLPLSLPPLYLRCNRCNML